MQTEADLLAETEWALLAWKDPGVEAWRSPFWSGVPMLTRKGGAPIRLAYCWSHARRRLREIYDSSGSEIAAEGLRRIAKLYAIEADIRGSPPEQRLAERQAQSAPLVEAFGEWLKQQRARISPKSRLGEKLAYIARHWDGLRLFLADGRVEMDSNAVENFARPIALARKKRALRGSRRRRGRLWSDRFTHPDGQAERGRALRLAQGRPRSHRPRTPKRPYRRLAPVELRQLVKLKPTCRVRTAYVEYAATGERRFDRSRTRIVAAGLGKEPPAMTTTGPGRIEWIGALEQALAALIETASGHRYGSQPLPNADYRALHACRPAGMGVGAPSGRLSLTRKLLHWARTPRSGARPPGQARSVAGWPRMLPESVQCTVCVHMLPLGCGRLAPRALTDL